MPNTLYKAEYGWKGKLLSLLYSSFVTTLFMSNPNGLVIIWQDYGWIMRIGLVLSFLSVPCILLGVIVSRTVFTETHIDHRTMFGVRIVREYTDIERVYLGVGFIRIHFFDGWKVKIYSGRADIVKIFSIIRKRARTDLPTDPYIIPPREWLDGEG
jgi:hypothetical protein